MSRSHSPLGTKLDAPDGEKQRTHSVDARAELGDDRRHTHHDIPDHGHNPSAQKGVDENPDLTLHYSHEHQHTHLHHGRPSLAGRHDDVLYAEGTTFDRSNLNDPGPQDYSQHHLRGERADQKDFVTTDAEKGALGPAPVETNSSEEEGKQHRLPRVYSKYKIFVHLFIWLLFTGWWIAGLVMHRHDLGWLIPFLLYLAITLRLIFFWVPITIVTKPMHLIWNHTGVRVYQMTPEKFRLPLAALVAIAVILIGSFVSKESADNTRGNRAISLLGLALMIVLLWATSRDRRKIRWHTVIGGMLTQFVIAVFVLRTKAGYDIFNFISFLARELLGFADQGTAFLTATSVTELGWFLTGVVPPIIFFVALVQVLYYLGILQWFIGKFAVFFFWSLRVSGAEAVVAAASPFIGQGESAMLIRPFVPHLTLAEIHQVMTSGFATIAGSVLVAYIGLGLNPQALVSSCIMSIPASLAVSKMRYPETEETITSGRVVIPDDDEHKASNALHAFANGAWLGIKIAGMIVATLLCIIALIGLINGLLGWWGRYINITQDGDPYLTLQLILGYICYPVAFLLGVPRDDLLQVGELIGIKVIANEFVAYNSLTSEQKYIDMSPRSRLIATYALCGFGNFGSLGTQIGVLSQISPSRTGDVSRVALSALFSGVLSTLTSASIAGLLVTDQATLAQQT
ncbi:CNT family concentrative nucleoside transporter [Capronia coronata CBS 617.96]|uniref:CNT family concentrative nucleoside transporter n=1 Tax=Capronia coronata CBS 617.96 TaxID=1182541 RepID=W9YMK4_9EURO|nr:CNT family concentrative nucleoside transporter [Capronia coronata CBS 617.96]EXJ83499.1 CNT family concentrative nucleoside transporter [Capronia coronata CBS 617.96]